MSFETLIWLGLTLLFVIAPLFGNKGKKDQKQQPGQPGQRPGQAPASGQPRTRSAAPRQQAGGQQQQAGGFESRLEEARRRIEAAMTEESAQVPRQQAQRQAPPASAPAAYEPKPAPVFQNSATGQPVAGQARPDSQPPRRPPPSRAAKAASNQAAVDRKRRMRQADSESGPQVTRRARKEPYTVQRKRPDAGGLFTTESVMSGIIWHQILSEPPHKRGNRRRTSRLR